MAPPESELRDPGSPWLVRLPDDPVAEECEPMVVVTSKTEASAPLGDEVTVEMSVSTGACVLVPLEPELVLSASRVESPDDARDDDAEDAEFSDCDAADDDEADDDVLRRVELALFDAEVVSDEDALDRATWVDPSTPAFSYT